MALMTALIVGASVGGGVAAYKGAAAQTKATKAATEEAKLQNAAAVQSVKDAQANASTQAQTALDAKRRQSAGSQTIFTSPLGLKDQASTAKKTLLGQ